MNEQHPRPTQERPARQADAKSLKWWYVVLTLLETVGWLLFIFTSGTVAWAGLGLALGVILIWVVGTLWYAKQ